VSGIDAINENDEFRNREMGVFPIVAFTAWDERMRGG